MTSLPRKCDFCRKRLLHYGMCGCADSRLAAIDAERKQIEKRQDELDALEREVLGLRPLTSSMGTEK